MTAPADTEIAYRDAHRAFTDAIHTVAGPEYGTLATDNGPRVATGPSVYEQLRDALSGDEDGQPGNRRTAKIPYRADIAQHLRDIDDNARRWAGEHRLTATDTPERGSTHEHPTLTRLWALDGHTWRPQDTAWLRATANTLTSWAAKAHELLDPPRRLDLTAECPACGKRYYYRTDEVGEVVRTAALQITPPHGCTCQVCHTTWGPELFMHLARVLACPLPEGVLE